MPLGTVHCGSVLIRIWIVVVVVLRTYVTVEKCRKARVIVLPTVLGKET